MRIDNAHTVPCFDIVHDHAFQQRRLTGSRLSHDVAMPQAVVGGDPDLLVVAHPRCISNQHALGRQIARSLEISPLSMRDSRQRVTGRRQAKCQRGFDGIEEIRQTLRLPGSFGLIRQRAIQVLKRDTGLRKIQQLVAARQILQYRTAQASAR